MELKIYSPQEDGFSQMIKWNHEELKVGITERAQGYETCVYTEDMLQNARKDRADLRKFIEALENKRKEIKKKCLEPYEQFEREEKELVSIVQRAVDHIDQQVKEVEERRKEEKTAKIREFYDENIHDLEKYLPFERVFRPEFANASVTMKAVKQEILDMIQRVSEGIAILNEVDSKFAGDMKAAFLKTYDIGFAMAERNRLEQEEQRREAYMAEQRRKKEEQEARLKAEAETVMNAGKKKEEVSEPRVAERPAVQEAKRPAEASMHVIDFRVHVTDAQLDALKAFLVTNEIRYEPVPRG